MRTTKNPKNLEVAIKTIIATGGIPLIMYCPACKQRHIDVGVWAVKLHKVHACQSCGVLFQPSLVPTVGVQFLPGCKNEEG